MLMTPFDISKYSCSPVARRPLYISAHLFGKGLIEKFVNPDNGRSPLFRLSKRGEKILAAITRAADPWHRRVGKELSLDDLRRARAALAVLMRFARGQSSAEAGAHYATRCLCCTLVQRADCRVHASRI